MIDAEYGRRTRAITSPADANHSDMVGDVSDVDTDSSEGSEAKSVRRLSKSPSASDAATLRGAGANAGGLVRERGGAEWEHRVLRKTDRDLTRCVASYRMSRECECADAPTRASTNRKLYLTSRTLQTCGACASTLVPRRTRCGIFRSSTSTR